MTKDTIDTITSVLTQKELDAFCSKYNIFVDLRPELPSRNDMIRNTPEGKIGIYTHFIKFANFRIPLFTFLLTALEYYRINFSQLSILAAPTISPFEILCRSEGHSVERDPLPSDDIIDLNLMGRLNKGRAAIRKYPKVFLFVIGLSRSFVEDDVRPTFLDSSSREMGLFNFIKFSNPFKVKVRERTLADEERVAFNDNLSPVKKVKGSSSASLPKDNPTTGGKTPVVLQRFVTQSIQEGVGSGSTTAAMDEFISSSVTPSPDHKYQDESSFAQGGNVRTRPVADQFVVISLCSPSTKPMNTESSFLKYASHVQTQAVVVIVIPAHEADASSALAMRLVLYWFLVTRLVIHLLLRVVVPRLMSSMILKLLILIHLRTCIFRIGMSLMIFRWMMNVNVAQHVCIVLECGYYSATHISTFLCMTGFIVLVYKTSWLEGYVTDFGIVDLSIFALLLASRIAVLSCFSSSISRLSSDGHGEVTGHPVLIAFATKDFVPERMLQDPSWISLTAYSAWSGPTHRIYGSRNDHLYRTPLITAYCLDLIFMNLFDWLVCDDHHQMCVEIPSQSSYNIESPSVNKTTLIASFIMDRLWDGNKVFNSDDPVTGGFLCISLDKCLKERYVKWWYMNVLSKCFYGPRFVYFTRVVEIYCRRDGNSFLGSNMDYFSLDTYVLMQILVLIVTRLGAFLNNHDQSLCLRLLEGSCHLAISEYEHRFTIFEEFYFASIEDDNLANDDDDDEGDITCSLTFNNYMKFLLFDLDASIKLLGFPRMITTWTALASLEGSRECLGLMVLGDKEEERCRDKNKRDHGFIGYPFDFRVTLGFGSIADGLDHVNLVIILPLEHGISRTRRVVDSNGLIPGLTASEALKSIQKLTDHSHKWHDEESKNTSTPFAEDGKVLIILGRPMLATAHARIDVFGKKISLEVGTEQITFEINERESPAVISPGQLGLTMILVKYSVIPTVIRASVWMTSSRWIMEEDKSRGIHHPYQKIKGFYRGCLKLGDEYKQDQEVPAVGSNFQDQVDP
nr:putative transposase (putative), gypsy type [Tanacetum cinerariifolium]